MFRGINKLSSSSAQRSHGGLLWPKNLPAGATPGIFH